MKYLVMYSVLGKEVVFHQGFMNIKTHNGELGTVCRHREDIAGAKKYIKFGNAINTANKIKKEKGLDAFVVVLDEGDNTVYFKAKVA